MKVSEDTFASLFIGNEFSRIDIYNKENLVMTRGIKTGINSMTQEIAEAIGEKTGKANVEKEEARKILFSLVDPDTVKLNQTDIGFDLKDEDKFAMITSALERLSRQIDRTLEHYASTPGGQRVEKLYVSLGMNVYNPILDYINDQLGIKAEHFDPFGQQSAYKVAESLKLSEKVLLVPVLGLSFSDNNRTPNAIFNYREKNREMSVKRINRGIFVSFAAALIICFAVMIYQILEANNQSTHLKTLNKELSLFASHLSTENISALMEEVKAKKQLSRQYAQRHLGAATIGEISGLTPDNIRLTSLKINTGSSNPPKENPDKVAKEISEDVILEGVVSGDRNTMDSLLAQYVMKLENSPMLRQVSVQKSSVITIKKVEVLYFTLSAKIG
jgi:hypothetical protein